MITSLKPFVGRKVFAQLKAGSQFFALHAKEGLPSPLIVKSKTANGGEEMKLQPFPFIAAEVVEFNGEVFFKIPDEVGRSGLKMLILPDLSAIEFVTTISDDPAEKVEEQRIVIP